MEIFEWIGKIVAIVGGVGVIMVGVSAFLSRLWGNWFIERQKSEYAKLLEHHKHQLAIELEKIRSIGNRANFKEQMVFENELVAIKKLVSISYKINTNALDLLEATISSDGEKVSKIIEDTDKMYEEFRNITIEEIIYIDSKLSDLFMQFQDRYLLFKMQAIPYKNEKNKEAPSDEFREALAAFVEIQAKLMERCRQYLLDNTKL